MTTISSTFTANGVSSYLNTKGNENVQYSVTAPFDGTIQFERAVAGNINGAWEIIAGPWSDASTSKSDTLAVGPNAVLRMRAKDVSTGLQTNGTFAADTDWTKGTGWAIAAGVATATTASTALSQTVTLIAGASYSVTFTIANAAAGSVAVSLGGGTAGTARSTDDTFTETIVAGSSDSLLAFTGDGFTGDIDNVTVVPVITYSFNDTVKIVKELRDDAGNVVATLKEDGLEIPGNLTVTGNVAITGTTAATGAITPSGGIARTGQQRIYTAPAKVGATAGWTVAAATDLWYAATMAAGGTASTLVVPITGLKVGDTITAFSVIAQIESAGNTATLDADLRKITNVAAEPTDASIGAITQVSVTADTAVAASKTLATPEVVGATETFYVLITGTTAANTDIILQGVTVTVTEA